MQISVADSAAEMFNSGYNCAQSVATPLAEKAGLDPERIRAISAPFGGGVARSRNVCGAVSGMLMILGATHPDMTKAEIYALSREAMERFEREFGSVICSELLAGIESDSSPVPSERTKEYYAERPCEKFIRFASSLAESLCIKK